MEAGHQISFTITVKDTFIEASIADHTLMQGLPAPEVFWK